MFSNTTPRTFTAQFLIFIFFCNIAQYWAGWNNPFFLLHGLPLKYTWWSIEKKLGWIYPAKCLTFSTNIADFTKSTSEWVLVFFSSSSADWRCLSAHHYCDLHLSLYIAKTVWRAKANSEGKWHLIRKAAQSQWLHYTFSGQQGKQQESTLTNNHKSTFKAA